MQHRYFACKICGGDTVPFTTYPPPATSTVRCRDCGLIQVVFGSLKEQGDWVCQYSDPGYYHCMRVLDGFKDFEERRAHDRRIAVGRFENLQRHTPAIGTLLDVGASNGAFIAEAESRGFLATGLEPDPWTVKQAKMDNLVCSFVEDWAGMCADGVYDVVTFIDSFEHVLNPKVVLRLVHRVLADDGLLVIEMPDAGCDGVVVGPSWKHFKPEEHAFLYTQRHVDDLLGMTSFILIDTIVPYPEKRTYYVRKAV